jgi:hypothetical protein
VEELILRPLFFGISPGNFQIFAVTETGMDRVPGFVRPFFNADLLGQNTKKSSSSTSTLVAHSL